MILGGYHAGTYRVSCKKIKMTSGILQNEMFCKYECFIKAGVSFFKMFHDLLCSVSIPSNTLGI
jgi:hypothetical protein